jgi:SNF2 family DNA or RNA helicase
MNAKIEKCLQVFAKYLERTNMSNKPYQTEGLEWCLSNELCENPVGNIRGGFIADEMGLGKTILMIGTFLCNLLPKTLIVLPVALIEQWYTEIYRTTGHKAVIYHGTNKSISLEVNPKILIVLTSYDTISNEKSLLHKINWDRVVFDEAHHLRNNKTKRLIGAKLLKSKIRWLVSGTPVQNKKKDYETLCSVVDTSETIDPQYIRRHFVLKRTKREVGIIIPELIHTELQVAWKNEAEKKLSEDAHNGLLNSDMSCKLTTMYQSRLSCIFPKILLTSKNNWWITPEYEKAMNATSKLDKVSETILSRKNGKGKLIFCHYRKEIDELYRRLREGGMNNIAIFDGRIPYNKRQEILSQKKEAIILQIQTGCEGLNLQENYSEIYFVSPNWNPAVEDQAIARCHRIGQTKEVNVFRFTMDENAMDNYINKTQESKRFIINETFA